jgi:hypothetical protein
MIDNLTPFGAAASFAYGLDDRSLVVVAVAATFRMPAAGSIHRDRLQPADDQPPPPIADQHWDDPASSSLRVPGQCAPVRENAEIYLQGSAWAPGGRPLTRMRTRLQIGPCRKDVDIVGDRAWIGGVAGVRPSAPAPFTSMPLEYERAFGGSAHDADGRLVAQEPRNPIGRGVYASAAAALDQPLPNLTRPGEEMASWSDRATPWGYGPIPGSWQPRLARAGRFDEEWIKTRLPLWPTDTSPRFFEAAPEGLVHPGPIREPLPVVLDGFDPDGTLAFRLPVARMIAKSYFADRVERARMPLSGVLIDVDRRAITLFWRHAVPLGRNRRVHLRTVVRVLDDWESEPE